jgi:hypothetical protein
MKSCPNCGRSVETGVPVCGSCGWLLTATATLQAADAFVPDSSGKPDPVELTPRAGAPDKAVHSKRRRITPAFVAFLIGAVGSLIVVSMTRSSVPPSTTSANVAAHANATSPSSSAIPAADRPQQAEGVSHWVKTEQWDRRTNRPAGVTLELTADHDVAVWNKRVRPVLTVRCLSRTSEVFVLTRSAASVESDAALHTVHLTFDNNADVEQKWQHSIDHEALFAPDGGAMMQQLARARTLSFRFSPFNASAVAVDFSVSGLDAQLASTAKACGSTQ